MRPAAGPGALPDAGEALLKATRVLYNHFSSLESPQVSGDPRRERPSAGGRAPRGGLRGAAQRVRRARAGEAAQWRAGGDEVGAEVWRRKS